MTPFSVIACIVIRQKINLILIIIINFIKSLFTMQLLQILHVTWLYGSHVFYTHILLVTMIFFTN